MDTANLSLTSARGADALPGVVTRLRCRRTVQRRKLPGGPVTCHATRCPLSS